MEEMIIQALPRRLALTGLYATVISVCISLIVLPGCATIGAPNASEEATIRAGQKTIVLLRVAGNVGGQPVNGVKRFGFKIASIDKGEPPQVMLFPSSPSSETEQQGWMYTILDSGETYYLSSEFGVGKADLPFLLSPDMWFRIPDNSQLVYIGSLSVSCEGKINYFGQAYVNSCSRLFLTDETTTAESVARDAFPSYRLSSTALMSPAINDSQPPPAMAQLTPLGIAVSVTETMATPDWYNRALKRATGIGDWINKDTVQGLGGLGGGYPAGAAGAGIVMGYLLYLPIGTALGLAGGADSESKWQPCMEKLRGELRTFDPEAQLRISFESALRENGIHQLMQIPMEKDITEKTQQAGLKTILQVDMQRVNLAECSERWTFRVEAQTRVRLRETTSGNYLYDRIFLNSHTLYPYQSYIQPGKCRKIEEYCGEGGVNILREELTEAINSSVENVVKDMSASPSVSYQNIGDIVKCWK